MAYQNPPPFPTPLPRLGWLKRPEGLQNAVEEQRRRFAESLPSWIGNPQINRARHPAYLERARQQQARQVLDFIESNPPGTNIPTDRDAGRFQAMAGDVGYSHRFPGEFQRAASRSSMALPAAVLGAGLLAALLAATSKKSNSGRERSDTSGKRRAPIVSRKPIHKTAPYRGAYKKGGVVKKRKGKKAGKR